MSNDDVNVVLKEIAGLLRRQVEHFDAATEKGKKSAQEFEKRRLETEQKRKELETKLARSSETYDAHRQEERQFRERLLATLDRQNQALEAIVASLKRTHL